MKTPSPIANCMNCGNSTVSLFLDLGLQPSGNTFITSEEIDDERFYPLRMAICHSCWQVQLLDHLDSKLLFEDHAYLTSTNKPIVDHFGQLAEKISSNYRLSQSDLVLDIGCNDGTLLSKFSDQDVLTMGVEPSRRIARLARENGHVVANTFWSGAVGKYMSEMGIQPKVITAMSVFYHVSDLNDFVAGVEQVMDTDTVFVIQAVSLISMLAKNQFDHFYHEHTCIHSLSSIRAIIERKKLRIIDVEEVDVHGGSFIAYIARRESIFQTSPTVAEFAQKEIAFGLKQIETYTAFADRVESVTRTLKQTLISLKQDGKSIYGLGAPLKSSTLMNYAGITRDQIDCLTELNELKIGKLSPGVHVPVVDERTLEQEPDYYMVFAWNYLDYLLEKKREYLKSGGAFIVPFPEMQIITGDDIE